ncbi:carboxypeptidase-like regulatory domain-containing protein [Methanolobus psychrotolerans]|uniref:carboxypeptidase-like regulatory domain-containing protein n=1 Tax=Methanolobus psychrotolerans TaxID=1874706 RepID=UPI000B91581E|nr:carboxypeptidase-like regulatory domain-containing protein [Methanolobus psychrotolerans]
MFSDDSASVGLPIRIVVLTIIGMIGIYVIISSIMSTPFVPGSMYAVANCSSFNMTGTVCDSPELIVSVFDNDGRPIGGANVIVWGPGRKKAVGGVTDASGEFDIKLLNISLAQGKTEGYLSVRVMQEGYLDYTNDFLVKVRKV